jgi:hypothetical protein
MLNALHEVHASHEQYKVNQEKPVSLKSNFAFLDESLAYVVSSGTNTLALDVSISLEQAQTECDDKNWWTSPEPEKRTPACKPFSTLITIQGWVL